jgi:hypothetical protein
MVVVTVPTEVKGNKVQGIVGHQHTPNRGNAEDHIAPQDTHPFVETVHVEYPCIV